MVNPKVIASWDANEVMIFCDLCIKEIGLGNRPTAHFSKDGWKNLIAGFKEQIGKTYDRMQMKNKCDHLKKDWKIWKELKLGETGLGWDQEKRTIAASDQWWEDKIKVVPDAKKFRHAGISPELEEKLNTMFSQVVATGEDSWAPSIGSVPPDMQHTVDEADRAEDDLEIERRGAEDLGGHVSTNVSNASTSSDKRRKMGKNRGVGISYMTELREAALSAKPPPVISIKDAVDMICNLKEIREDKRLYYFALNHVKDKNNREIFLTLPEEDRVWWIRSAFEGTNL